MILQYKKNSLDNYKSVRQVLFGEFNISYILSVRLKKNKKIFLNDCIT